MPISLVAFLVLRSTTDLYPEYYVIGTKAFSFCFLLVTNYTGVENTNKHEQYLLPKTWQWGLLVLLLVIIAIRIGVEW